MAPPHLAKLEAAKSAGKRVFGALYRRTRGKGADKRSAWELRFDDVAGCLRIPTGGSSRQTIMIVEGSIMRSRLLSPREAARLMGLPDDYQLPRNYNDAYGLRGDGVAVPAVRFLAENIFEPILAIDGGNR
jgi:DNA (cytosine-5)-methyltransferase 1